MPRSTLVDVPGSLRRYFNEISRNRVLTYEEEQALARAYKKTGDPAVAHRLVTANLRFVVKIAYSYRSCGARLTDLIQEGNLGLMKAVQRFDPDRGLRLVSYAVWSIRAYIQAYILRTHSLVKLGTTRVQRKLFFSLARTTREVEHERERERDGGSPADDTGRVAERLGVTARDVEEMAARVAARDVSLDAPLGDEGTATRLDLLADGTALVDHGLGTAQVDSLLRRGVRAALERLGERERYIVEQRLLADDPRTLTDIAQDLHLSRERVRQLEGRAKEKLRRELVSLAAEIDWPFAAKASDDDYAAA
jgi:RNA polymerase sigma-32 factor